VRDEFERYLDCGLLCRGFARLECEQCHEQHLVAFSCKVEAFARRVSGVAWRRAPPISWTTCCPKCHCANMS
jgi:hypothetical protein